MKLKNFEENVLEETSIEPRSEARLQLRRDAPSPRFLMADVN